ncbi:TIGR04222 domain-containing membrane protein [Streptomyces sp. NPDC096339]|uniref:TIGR04222 domain-containing membrane protein n=1 Tax=Streptomyces sp. NPDC096339 TaxID=3366086 RepID=UPI0038246D53
MSFTNVLAVVVWVGVLASSLVLVRGLRGPRPRSGGSPAVPLDLSEAAFLVGGPGGVVDAALAAMLTDGRLVAGGPGLVQVRPGARAGDPAERAVLQAHQAAPSGWLYQVRYQAMLNPAVQEIGDALAARGLLSPPESGPSRRRWGVVQAVVCAVLIPVSIPLTIVGMVVLSDSVPFILVVLPALLGGIVMGVVGARRARSRLTPAGARALTAVRRAYQNDQSPHVRISLSGLRGLRDPHLRQQLVPAARGTRLAAAQSGSRTHDSHGSHGSDSSSDVLVPVVWCAGSDGGGSGSSCGSGSNCGSSGSSCGGSGTGCSSSGSSCGSSSSSCSSSSCSSSSGSSCSSSS